VITFLSTSGRARATRRRAARSLAVTRSLAAKGTAGPSGFDAGSHWRTRHRARPIRQLGSASRRRCASCQEVGAQRARAGRRAPPVDALDTRSERRTWCVVKKSTPPEKVLMPPVTRKRLPVGRNIPDVRVMRFADAHGVRDPLAQTVSWRSRARQRVRRSRRRRRPAILSLRLIVRPVVTENRPRPRGRKSTRSAYHRRRDQAANQSRDRALSSLMTGPYDDIGPSGARTAVCRPPAVLKKAIVTLKEATHRGVRG